MKKATRPKFLSLFSGCGGLDLGFIKAGFEGRLSVDIDDVALSVHKENLNCPVQKLDLTHTDPELDSVGDIDVILAGSPCQGFSTAGNRRLDDPRNSLLLVVPRVAEKYKSKVIVAENVPGALCGAHRTYWDALCEHMSGLGYQTEVLHLNSADFGAAQHRRRIFLVAWRTPKMCTFTLPKVEKATLRNVLVDLDGKPNHFPVELKHGSSDLKIALRIGQGQKLTNARSGDRVVHTWDIPEVFGRTTSIERKVLNEVLKRRRQVRRRDFGDADPVCTSFLEKTFGSDILKKLVEKNYLRQIGSYHDLTGTFNGKFRRLHMDTQSRTVDTRFGDHRLFLHPIEHRAFTVREAARIQGFPDDFIFSGNTTQQFKMIGNAVPVPLAQGIADFVRTLI